MSKKDRPLIVHHEATLPPQQILDLFKISFHNELYETDQLNLQKYIQIVKSNLYDRDYISAFDMEIKRIAYCCRWSSFRAIAYASLFASLTPVKSIIQCQSLLTTNTENIIHSEENSILCIGGGACGELISIASIFAPSRNYASKYLRNDIQNPQSKLTIYLVDIADWSQIISRISHAISSNWLYDYSKNFIINFLHKDVLTLSPSELNLRKLNLITLLFTTNELFMKDKSTAIKLLQMFSQNCKSGCYLLIVESAGSYSHITVGSKKFPIQFLIDTILLGTKENKFEGDWELIDQTDSKWYRYQNSLDYPINLENMRFFYRLYMKK